MLDDDTIQRLKRAGAAAVTFNAPLGPDRAAAIVRELSLHEIATAVDLGCGRAALVEQLVAACPNMTAIGVDSDTTSIAAARSRVAAAGLAQRLDLRVGDAAAFVGSSAAALCVGASHAFGGAAPMLAALGRIPTCRDALVGDGLFVANPTESHRAMFGDLPLGLDACTKLAHAAGWTVDSAELATLDEWDAFERGWTDGVRAVGTEEASRFADRRTAAYAEYRGVLGFAWLRLSRPT